MGEVQESATLDGEQVVGGNILDGEEIQGSNILDGEEIEGSNILDGEEIVGGNIARLNCPSHVPVVRLSSTVYEGGRASVL